MNTKINMNALPRHVGIIMDGNGRWAQRMGKVRTFGHKFGVETVRRAIEYCSETGIEVLTLYAFSTENWKRPEKEVSTLMNLIVEFLAKETQEMKRNNVKLRFIGDMSRIPKKPLESIRYAEKETRDNTGVLVNIALNYGGHDEIVRAVRLLYTQIQKQGLSIQDITAEDIEKYLYTADNPPVDLIIRTGGEVRLSNFLTWQSAYSELYFCDVLWPDFTKEDFDKAILYFQNKDRRYGALTEKKDQ